ncbi:dihydroneopterin triphosphate diphosphatase [Glaciimonas immobilis]|uniref:dATP pyrophosphohydrolase n=1 Tax=Glaciimonas immobilis TaxID=728004 RepID=A0A840RYB2_9BURK|nr:dihydroneopterin triphosphate diphosphatase [Glaciimonas immobilis]KAF3998530.1 dihydroneopterin triphosphate diphosphatase [Glaciimonas immobilis]MBB5201379.1 dATP pyrophosphohydrolase [Glaciimonas immobilis]
MNKIPESVLVVIHTVDLQVLMISRADKVDFWQSVTGSKDTLAETPLQTAIREVAEETGIIVGSDLVPSPQLRDWHLSNVYEIYPMWRHRYAPGVTTNTEHVFSLQVPADIRIVLSPREHVEYRWMPHRAAADLCFSPSNAEAILHLPHYLG